MNLSSQLSRRERQIMEILYQRGAASVAVVLAALPDPPSYSAVRALLAILETKGHVKHVEDGPRYTYKPTHARHRVAKSALQQVVRVFYEGSLDKVVAALLDSSETKPTAEELDRLQKLIEQARKEGG